jgi:hypothetical protein
MLVDNAHMQVPMIDWAAHAFGMVGGLLVSVAVVTHACTFVNA